MTSGQENLIVISRCVTPLDARLRASETIVIGYLCKICSRYFAKLGLLLLEMLINNKSVNWLAFSQRHDTISVN